MSVAGAIFAVTFLVFLGVTLIFPSVPLAQLLYECAGIQTALSIGGISVAVLLSGIMNGGFWAIFAIATYGLANLALNTRRPLPPMPVAPRLTARLPRKPLVDSRVNRIPPALTIPPMPSHSRDLLRVRGIGRKYAALLESAGVKTVTDLSRQDPRYLCQTLRIVNREKNLVRRSPPYKTIEIWIHNARNLEPMLVKARAPCPKPHFRQ